MDVVGTFPASLTTGRYYKLAELPPADHAPQAYADLLDEYRLTFATLTEKRGALSKITADLKKADETWLQEAAEAQRQGKKQKDPRPALREGVEQAQVDVAVAETACVELSSRIFDLRSNPAAQAEWKSATDAARAELLERSGRQRDELEETLTEVAEVDFAAGWANPNGKAVRILLGSAELGRLEKLLALHADRRPTRFVSPAAMERLKKGEDAEDVDGVAISFEEADKLHRANKLKVRHGRLQRVERPEFT